MLERTHMCNLSVVDREKYKMCDMLGIERAHTQASSAPAHLAHTSSPLSRLHVRVRLKMDTLNTSSTSCFHMFQQCNEIFWQNSPTGRVAHQQRAGLVVGGAIGGHLATFQARSKVMAMQLLCLSLGQFPR